MPDKPISQILLEAGCINRTQLEVALREQRTTNEKIEAVLERLGFVSHREILGILGKTFNTPFVDFSKMSIERAVLELVPERLARTSRLIPIECRNGSLVVAMADPNDILAIDELRMVTGLNVEPRIADEVELGDLIDDSYGVSASSDDAIDEVVRQALRIDDEDTESPPLIRLVDLLIIKGIRDRATDIHFEADQVVGRIRYRIDGVLHMSRTLPKKTYTAAVSRVKVMGGMDITNNRIPQDGGISFPTGARHVDIRVSTMPGAHGESCVMRLLEKPRFILSLEAMGYRGENLDRFKRLIQKPWGMIVVTGPTGAGKSTTLYGALRMMNALEKAIVTVEDPIEYRIPLVKQTQVNSKAGYTFANALRAILRHDPDIILIGEMRDKETAEIACKAAMTGHLLFTTLHANTASAAIPRLVDMGIEPFIVATSVLAVIGQRLVRRICAQCKEEYVPMPEEFPTWYADQLRSAKFYRGAGCADCRQTGYRGRVGVYELLEVSPEVSAAVAQGATPAELEKVSQIQSMRIDALEKVRQGVTTLPELERVLG